MWHIFLIAVAPTIPEAVRAGWKIPAIRLFATKLYHRVGGPTYEVQAGGTIWTTTPESEGELLRLGLSTAKKVYTNAKVETALTNRVIIKADRSRTIRIDLPQDFDDDDEHMDSDEGTGGHDREVMFQLWGYSGKATGIETMLEREIAPFFDQMIAVMQEGHTPGNFWLRIHMEGKNPFLQFYLRDVPDAEVGKFQLDLTDVFAGDSIRVAIGEDSFRLSANNPRGLVNSAKSYLSTPALAHRDRC